LLARTSFVPEMASSTINENSPDHLRGDAEEMGAALPIH
jgi:hypothetical protein